MHGKGINGLYGAVSRGKEPRTSWPWMGKKNARTIAVPGVSAGRIPVVDSVSTVSMQAAACIGLASQMRLIRGGSESPQDVGLDGVVPCLVAELAGITQAQRHAFADIGVDSGFQQQDQNVR